MNALYWVISDILIVTKRNLIRYIRLPQLMVFATIQPVMFLLLFTYVFGGAIRVPGEYINFLLPGILVQTVLFGATSTTVGLAEDLSKGMVERFRSLPMARSAVLAGRVLADLLRNAFVVTLMLSVGALIGFRFGDGWLNGLLAIPLILGFGFGFSWISALIGLSVKNPEAAQVAGFIWVFPLVFASSVFVPPQTMPDWLRAFAEHQPITLVVNAARGLMMGGLDISDVWKTLAWIAGLTVVFMSLSVRAYRRVS